MNTEDVSGIRPMLEELDRIASGQEASTKERVLELEASLSRSFGLDPGAGAGHAWWLACKASARADTARRAADVLLQAVSAAARTTE